MTIVMPDPALPDPTLAVDPSEIVVVVPEGSGAAAMLSCRLHGVIAGAGDAARRIVVHAGERADEPDLVRVIACARDSAVSRGLGFVVR